ncbi:hypothetical protein HPP92_006157 [Vanilla planifolia]|uniref:Uncharacterized protein n=1 Tax=Vanilla planifolia TaxID=51239 RepID=A0A835V9R3_VANPL|nr:hypothetical protein HPP92_006157 [Vanilla planifolia]
MNRKIESKLLKCTASDRFDDRKTSLCRNSWRRTRRSVPRQCFAQRESDNFVSIATLSEQAEPYDGKIHRQSITSFLIGTRARVPLDPSFQFVAEMADAIKNVAQMDLELTIEIGTYCRSHTRTRMERGILSSIEQKEAKANDGNVKIIRQ